MNKRNILHLFSKKYYFLIIFRGTLKEITRCYDNQYHNVSVK